MQLNVTHLLLHLTMINITKWTRQTDSTKMIKYITIREFKSLLLQ